MGEGLGSGAAGCDRTLVPPGRLQTALVLGTLHRSCAGDGSPHPLDLQGFIPGSARDAAPRPSFHVVLLA